MGFSRKHVSLILILSIIICDLVGSDDASRRLPEPEIRSPYYLIRLAHYERNLYNLVAKFDVDYRDLLPRDLRLAIYLYRSKYLDDIIAIRSVASYDESMDEGVTISQNPIMSFNMVWRFANELRLVQQLFVNYSTAVPNCKARSAFVDAVDVRVWPNNSNVDECILRLLRIQMVYDLDPEELAQGIISGVETRASLDAFQCYKLGVFASNSKQYTLAVPWLELALQKLSAKNDRNEHTLHLNASEVQVILDKTIVEHDGSWYNKRSYEHYFYVRKLKSNNTANDVNGSGKPLSIRKCDHTFVRRKKSSDYNDYNFWGLCSGENHQTEKEKAKLYCWYKRKLNPVLYISPIKTEMLSKTPYIIQMYDIISHNTTMKIKAMARPYLKRSLVFDDNKRGESIESLERTSVEGSVYEPFTNLSKLIEAVTGLSIIKHLSSEAFVQTSYTFGGHYDCHLDSLDYAEEFGDLGNRIATMMFYLENNQKGGLTAFPQAGTAATPIKGSGIFWYNLKRNGENDLTTYHCACPVVLGHKNIFTKWIRSYNQFQRRKCTLRKSE